MLNERRHSANWDLYIEPVRFQTANKRQTLTADLDVRRTELDW